MQLNTLTAKQLKVGIRAGKTRGDFCADCGCTEKELVDKINSLYSRNKRSATDILKSIDRNEKKVRKVISVPIAPVQVKAEIVTPPLVQEKKQPSQKQSQPDVLKTLKAQKAIQSQEVVKLEAEHKELVNQHRVQVNDLRALTEEIDGLRTAFRQKCQKYEEIANRSNQVVSKMKSLSQLIRDKRDVLEETKRQILEHMRVTICAYRDGTIATMEESDVVLDDAGSDELYQELLGMKECEELRLKDVKVLARLIAIVRNSTLKTEVICDDQSLETVYKILSNLKTTST